MPRSPSRSADARARAHRVRRCPSRTTARPRPSRSSRARREGPDASAWRPVRSLCPAAPPRRTRAANRRSAHADDRTCASSGARARARAGSRAPPGIARSRPRGHGASCGTRRARGRARRAPRAPCRRFRPRTRPSRSSAAAGMTSPLRPRRVARFDPPRSAPRSHPASSRGRSSGSWSDRCTRRRRGRSSWPRRPSPPAAARRRCRCCAPAGRRAARPTTCGPLEHRPNPRHRDEATARLVGLGTSGGSPSHRSISSATQGPTARSSVSVRPAPRRLAASSSQVHAAFAARSSAWRRWPSSSCAAASSSSLSSSLPSRLRSADTDRIVSRATRAVEAGLEDPRPGSSAVPS